MHRLLLLGATTFLLSLFLTPLFRNRFRKKTVGVPRGGGVPIVLACLLGCALALTTGAKGNEAIWNSKTLALQIFGAAFLVFAVGLIDDLNRIEPWHKVAAQIVAACLVYRAGVHIQTLAGFDIGGWALPVTVVWILLCTTAIIVINRTNDLAVGIGLLATSTIFVLALLQKSLMLELATVPLVGSLLGFLPYRIPSPKILLGQSGALFIGFLIGCYSILWSQRAGTVVGITVPLLVLSVPLLDTAIVFFRRLLRRQPLTTNDTSHIYHRLLNRGFTPRKVSVVLYVCTAIGASVSLLAINNRHLWMVLLLFYGAAWIWIRGLGYVEFNVAGHMLMEGALLRQLHAEATIASYEGRLNAAATPEDYWAVVISGLNEFGFQDAQLSIAGTVFDWSRNPPSFGLWEVMVPIAESDYIRVSRAFGTGTDANGFAPFIDLVRRSLTAKHGMFVSCSRTL